MSIQFAANISKLRREKNITQKNAAEALGISQALLSHYEKGIRECSLEFVLRAAQYYDVTTDYLLGLSASRHGSNEIFESEPIQSDSQIKIKTVLRSFLQLTAEAEKKGEEHEIYFNDFFSLCIKKYISSISRQNHMLEKLCDMATNLTEAPQNSLGLPDGEKENITPLCTQTIEAHALSLINSKFKKAIKF